jgi:hypothetical protein
MQAGTGNAEVPHMSVTNVGASLFPTTPPPRSGQSGEGQASRSNVQNSNSNAATNEATTTNVTRNAVSGVTTDNNTDAVRNDNPLPPTQGATAPGTGQKVNIIA